MSSHSYKPCNSSEYNENSGYDDSEHSSTHSSENSSEYSRQSSNTSDTSDTSNSPETYCLWKGALSKAGLMDRDLRRLSISQISNKRSYRVLQYVIIKNETPLILSIEIKYGDNDPVYCMVDPQETFPYCPVVWSPQEVMRMYNHGEVPLKVGCQLKVNTSYAWNVLVGTVCYISYVSDWNNSLQIKESDLDSFPLISAYLDSGEELSSSCSDSIESQLSKDSQQEEENEMIEECINGNYSNTLFSQDIVELLSPGIE
ncbi:MAG: hypothetical protein Sylvanvirus28_3 [Sylvanvirus sp.]|uniref:Uncharacterized protein n=1 Tax=Sylvanvirus sp. TaxID=2487774 RepID=A0A3G5AM88_9VIRU|nr:MAG: hypothetical protein Sylvanvirus28_3 [Sylvanvirus sp.]